MPSIGSLCVGSFYIFIFLLQPLPWKVTFSGTQKSSQPTLFNLQASDLVHCEEETGAYYQLSRLTYKLVKKKLIFKVAYFAKKKYALFKKFPKIYYSFFFQKNIIGHTYICTKCNDNFKFTISLKLNGVKTFLTVSPIACLFYITRFLYGWQKIFTNKDYF